MNTWEDINLIEPKKNCSSSNELDPRDTTKSTKTDSIESKCDYIGFVRKCPKCKAKIHYCNIYSLRIGDKNKTCCKSCQNLALSKINTGKRISEFTKKKLSVALKGRTFSIETKRKISEHKKAYFKKNPTVISGSNNPMFGVQRFGINNPNFGNRWTEKQRKAGGLISKERIIKHKLSGNINRHEQGHKGNWYNKKACILMDNWSKENGCNLRHALNEGEFYYMGYFADGYDKDKNIWFEYDEKHHYYIDGALKKKDIDRMNTIIQNLKCKFYRYNEKKNKILKYG